MIDAKFIIVVAAIAIVFLGPIVGAFTIERRRRREAPNTRPYTWGLFIGLAVLIFYGWFAFWSLMGLFGFFLPGDNTKGSDAVGPGLLPMIVVSGLIASSGYFCVKRYRWAWVVATIATGFPVIWIVNVFYGKNRWQEFRG